MNAGQRRYQRAKSVVLSADALPREQQDAYIQAQCGDDPALLAQVPADFMRELFEDAQTGSLWAVNSHIQGSSVLGAIALRQGDAAAAAGHLEAALAQTETWPDAARESLRAASLEGLQSARAGI